jgi:hypothetical protein
MTDTAPTAVNRTLRRLPNAVYRQREYLTEKEVERLIEAARKRGRNGPRGMLPRSSWRTGMACERKNSARCAGLRSISGRGVYTLTGRREGSRACIHFAWARAKSAKAIAGQ